MVWAAVAVSILSSLQHISLASFLELRRGSTYLRKAVKVLKISFDAPIRKSHSHHHHHSHGHEKVNLQRACKAFMLKNFLLHPSLRLEYTFYYLCAMFSAYPELDYCIVRVPLGSKMSASLCALLQYFTVRGIFLINIIPYLMD